MCAAFHVDLPELEVVARLEPELPRLTDSPQLDCVLFREAVGRGRVRRVGDDVEELLEARFDLLELGLERLQLGLDALQLLELLGGRLPFQLLAGSQLLDAGKECAPLAICLEERVELLRRPLAGEGGAPGVRVGARGADVDHRCESKKASITWATPSSSTGGHTKSATASTRSCAFATATP